MDIVLRAAVIFCFVFLITRVVGRRELSSLEPFDMILLVVTGDLIQQGVTQSDYSVTGALTAVATMAVLTVFVSWVSFRSKRLRQVLDGQPIVLVMDGKVLDGNLKRERMRRDELEMEARLQGHESIDDLKLAILETGGKISCIAKS
ncbi:MAG: hypothetical protein QOG63_834 [Thermoleophilaceae bacterium]|jgi:uncharacterized membrane protein YcaP (DUF421 family)|nr:hypothetical protein [Thermoleophilaceae bacterium]